MCLLRLIWSGHVRLAAFRQLPAPEITPLGVPFATARRRLWH